MKISYKLLAGFLPLVIMVLPSNAKSVTTALLGDSIKTITEYYYDNPLHNYATRAVTTLSSGDVETLITTYPSDYVPNGSSFLYGMIFDNILSFPVEEIRYIVKENDTTVLAGTIKEYTSWGLVESVKTLFTEGSIPLSTFKVSNPSYGMASPTGIPSVYLPDTRYETRMSYSYDLSNNLKQYTIPDGISVCYLWSYNGQYPIAEIKNAEYSAVESILGAVNINTFSSRFPSKAEIDDFLAPLYYSLSSSQISKFVYDPLVGMTSATDVSGKRVCYEYDSFQRLKHIKDQEGKLLKAYDYHYKE